VDALLISFLAAALGEFGDRTQLLVVLLAVRFGRPAPVLAGVAVGGLVSALLAAAAGVTVSGIITLRAISLLVAVALIYAGATGMFEKKPLTLGERWRTGPFLTTAVCFFLAEFGDKSQFMTFAIAAQYDVLLLAALGATAGMTAAAAPAALLADRFAATLPLKAIRIGAAILFLLAGFIVAINALRLI
jgi:putative Ca2+/H+ antiporter (TMEM165/GDT1 family)